MRPARDNVRRLILVAITLIAVATGAAHARDSIAFYDGDPGRFYLKPSLAKSAGVSSFRFGPKAADRSPVKRPAHGDTLAIVCGARAAARVSVQIARRWPANQAGRWYRRRWPPPGRIGAAARPARLLFTLQRTAKATLLEKVTWLFFLASLSTF